MSFTSFLHNPGAFSSRWRGLCRAIFSTALLALVPTAITARAGDAPARSPFVAERLDDPIQWIEWTAGTPAALREAGRPVMIVISHELNSLSRAMAVESFANKDIAARVNEAFSAVVIDKNQYPGVASCFATAVHHVKQVRGWPVTVFTTPQLEYIDGGGYFSAADNWGNQGLSTVVKTITEQWSSQRDIVVSKAHDAAGELADFYGESSNPSVAYSGTLVSLAVDNLAAQFDFEQGGFSAVPKTVGFDLMQILDEEFARQGPHAHQAEKMRNRMWRAVLRGGVRDYVHGGFFAASTDEGWNVPDFRKTLPVQAQAIAHFARYPEFRHIVRETADSLLNEFLGDAGVFSEMIVRGPASGQTGAADGTRAYTWSEEELKNALSTEEFEALTKVFVVSAEGNVPADQDPGETFKGRNLLRMPAGDPPEAFGGVVRAALEKLRAASNNRSRLQRERVSGVSTNALAIAALVRASADQGSAYLKQAVTTARAVWGLCWDAGAGRLAAAVADGKALPGEASAHGYASYATALQDLSVAAREPEFREWAMKLLDVLAHRFGSKAGPVFETPSDDDSVPCRFYAFREDGAGSANAALLSIARDRAKTGAGQAIDVTAILHHLPEDVSFAPEEFPALLAAAAALEREQ